MKNITLVLPLLLCLPVFAQSDYSRVDSIAAAFQEPYTDAGDLSRKLTQSFDTEDDKARAIFMWIANNIRYDCNKYKNPPRPNISGSSQDEVLQKLSEWKKKELGKSLKNKKGVCEDYSQLFKAMCDAAGLEAVVITGDARDFYKPYRNAHDNPHAWNAVRIESQWHLLDATWAAGFVNPEVTKFTRRISPGYFKTPPAWFAQSHFPEDDQWQLLSQPLNKKTFPDQPLVNYGQKDYPVEDFSSTLQKNGDGKMEIRLKFSKTPENFMLTTSRSRPINFEQVIEKGYVVLRFSPKGYKEVIVFGGKSLRSSMDWIARYEVR